MSIQMSNSSSSLSSSSPDGEGENNEGDDVNEGSWVTPFISSYHQYLNNTAKTQKDTSVPPDSIVRTQCNSSHSANSNDVTYTALAVPNNNIVERTTGLSTAESTRSSGGRKSSADAMMLPAVAFLPPHDSPNRSYFHRGIGGRGNYHKVVPTSPPSTTSNNNNVATKAYPRTVPKINGSLGKSLRAIVRGKKEQDSGTNSLSDDSIRDYKDRVTAGNTEGMVAVGGTGGAGVVSVQKGLPPSKEPLPYGVADKLRMRFFGK